MKTFIGLLVCAVGMNIGIDLAAPGISVFEWRWWAAVVALILSSHIGLAIQGYRRVAP